MGDAWIDTVRIARDFGTVAELLPDGVDDVRDAPHILFEAIRTGLYILGWDELLEEERPPRRIWLAPPGPGGSTPLDYERLNEWFDEVKRKRLEKYGGADGTGPGEIEDPVQNEAARSLLVG